MENPAPVYTPNQVQGLPDTLFVQCGKYFTVAVTSKYQTLLTLHSYSLQNLRRFISGANLQRITIKIS